MCGMIQVAPRSVVEARTALSYRDFVAAILGTNVFRGASIAAQPGTFPDELKQFL
jgi:hypothetical protein